MYGIGLKPLLLDPLMPEPIAISEDIAGYHVRYRGLSDYPSDVSILIVIFVPGTDHPITQGFS